MAKVRVEINRSAGRALLQSPEVQAELKRRAEAIAREAGEGFDVFSSVGPNRARAVVASTTFDAIRAEAKDRVLTRAVDAGRG